MLILATTFASTAAVGREAFVDAKKPFYTACDYMLGLACQRIGSIGQTGTTVHRDGKGHGRTSGHRAVWAQDRRRRYCRRFFPVYELLFTLRRTQGAIESYKGTTGAAVAAAGRLRRLGRCRRRTSPAGERG